MGCSTSFILVFVSWVLFASRSTHQLRSYDTEILLQLMKHLEHPLVLTVWENSNGDLCSSSSPPQMSIKCENDSVTELRIIGAKPAKMRVISPAAKMRNPSASAYRVFSIKELEDATGKFEQSSYLGESTIGKVFKGKLEAGAFVAIRSLTLFRKYSVRNLKLRLDLLSKLCHPNLVNLLGHCVEVELQENGSVNRLFLVYKFIPNGNLCSHLSGTFILGSILVSIWRMKSLSNLYNGTSKLVEHRMDSFVFFGY